ncbi:MAG TPA: amidohydrolase family protein, partial [Kofleriaceae bacterium]|nr:amidohydrolase family protein [Kofleriaceae bacterium]
GLGLRLHVDQLTAGGGAALAAELGAVTADHLETITEEGIAALARAGVAATLLPTSTLYLKCPRYAPGRALADAGVLLALGSNCNPGSAMSESYSLALTLACLGNGLSAAEAFHAATAGGARALGLDGEIGSLEVGKRADVISVDLGGAHVVPTADPYSAVVYACRSTDVVDVVVDGRVVVRGRQLLTLDRRAVIAAARERAARVFARVPS